MIYRKKDRKTWYMKFMIRGQLVQRSTGTQKKTLAERIERDTHSAMEREVLGISEPVKVPLFSAAADEWLAFKEGSIAVKSYDMHKTCLRGLRRSFGNRLLSNITREEIKAYQRRRLTDRVERRPLATVKRKTVNLEIETLRGIMIHFRQWERLKGDVKMFTAREEDEVGRELSEVEQESLLAACQMSESRLLYPMVALALHAGPRFTTVRLLRWKWVNFEECCLKWGKDKTPAGSGRVVPLGKKAMEVLRTWAEQFPNRKPDDYVFPFGIDDSTRSALSLRRRPTLSSSSIDPTRPIGTIKTAWNTARRNAAWILAGRPDLVRMSVPAAIKAKLVPPFHCRFHDLRHTAGSNMIRRTKGNIPKVARIMGWSASTMVAMTKRYSHFRVEELREAVE